MAQGERESSYSCLKISATRRCMLNQEWSGTLRGAVVNPLVSSRVATASRGGMWLGALSRGQTQCVPVNVPSGEHDRSQDGEQTK